MLDAIFTSGAQSLEFAPLQPFRAYLWQAYMQSGEGHLPMPGMHWVAAPSTALSRGSLLLLISCTPVFPTTWWGIQIWGFGTVTQPLCLPYMVRRGLLFHVWFQPITWLTLNLWWVLNLVTLMCWLGIRLMSVLTHDLQSSLLLVHTFILGSLVRCHHLLTFDLNQGVRIIHF